MERGVIERGVMERGVMERGVMERGVMERGVNRESTLDVRGAGVSLGDETLVVVRLVV
jgi:hypothetical protein